MLMYLLLIPSSEPRQFITYISSLINGTPTDMDSCVQQYGWAGRDGSHGTGLLLYNAKQCTNIDMDMKSYLGNTDLCRRYQILKAYNANPASICKHVCCDLCSNSSTCDANLCSLHDHPYFESVVRSFSSDSSDSPDSPSSDSDWSWNKFYIVHWLKMKTLHFIF